MKVLQDNSELFSTLVSTRGASPPLPQRQLSGPVSGLPCVNTSGYGGDTGYSGPTCKLRIFWGDLLGLQKF